MALRPPSRYSASALAATAGSGLDLLDHELASEKASALGRAGERVEECLRRLRAAAPDSPARPALLKAASDAVYAYFVQRESCGLRRHGDVICEYAIPGEVLARLGAG